MRIVQFSVPFRPGTSAELVDFRLVDVIRSGQFFDQEFSVKMVGFHEIIERIAMISQLGVDQSQQEMRVHREVGGEVHGRNLSLAPEPGKAGCAEKS